MSGKLILMGGLAVAFGATSYYAGNEYLDSRTQARLSEIENSRPNQPQVKLETIVVAKAPLKFGERLDASMLKEIPWPADHRPEGSFSSTKELIGDKARRALSKNDGWQKVLEDVAFVNGHIRSRHPEMPVICFGHSMGATISLSYAQTYPDTIDGLVVWNGSETGFMPGMLRQLLKIERMFKGSDVPSMLAQKLTFEDWNTKFKPNRTEFDWLSRDKAEVDKYVADPLCGFPVSIGMWIDLLAGLAATTNAMAKIPADLPINLQAGGDDPCSSLGKAVTKLEAALRQSGKTNIDARILANTRHECLNETNREETMRDFVLWLDKNFK